MMIVPESDAVAEALAFFEHFPWERDATTKHVRVLVAEIARLRSQAAPGGDAMERAATAITAAEREATERERERCAGIVAAYAEENRAHRRTLAAGELDDAESDIRALSTPDPKP